MLTTIQSQVYNALAPVFVLIATGALAARQRWVSAHTIAQLSKLVFYVFMPGLLFRTMSRADFTALDFAPVGVYFSVIVAVYGVLWHLRGRSARAATLALAAVFSNLVMIGVPLVTVAYGAAGLVALLTLVSVHAMILLTLATLAVEWAQTHSVAQPEVVAVKLPHRLWQAAKGAIVHPVPLPILAGLAFSFSGLAMPEVLDRSLQWLGAAAGPMALVMLGASTYFQPVSGHWRSALGLASTKLLLLPACVLVFSWLVGLRGLTLTVLVLAAAMPMGANVFLFSQRYRLCEHEVTVASSLSTVVAALSVSAWMALLGWLTSG